MTVNSRLSRLESMRPSRIVLLARMPDGREKEMTAPEYVEAVKDGADMMQLFAQGIIDNAGMLKSAFDKSLDFGAAPLDFSANYASGGYIGNVSTPREQNAPQNSGASVTPITIVVQSVLDGKVIGETSYNYIHNRERAYGGAY